MNDGGDLPEWVKSARSNTGNCVEVRALPDKVQMRHSQDPEGAVLAFDRDEFATFLQSVKDGDFDLP